MEQKRTCDFLIKDLPLEIYLFLQAAAKKHHRSINQEAIIVLTNGLSSHKFKIPCPFKWKTKISSQFLEKIKRK